MSVKIKINWDNENVVSESVRIYRADSIFTPASLPPLLTEIFGDIYEYEDLTVVENQTYFYMLSAKLGDEEAFTECFEVLASGMLWVNSSSLFSWLESTLLNNTQFNPLTQTASLNDFGLSLSGTSKWAGGVLGPDGKIYCIPSSATSVLIIDPLTQTASLNDFGLSLSGTSKWAGGVLGPDGKIYCAPYGSSNVLVIDLETQTASLETFGITFPSVNKFLGAVSAKDGKIYFTGNTITNLLGIDPTIQTATYETTGLDLSGASSGVVSGDKICIIHTARLYLTIFNTITKQYSQINLASAGISEGVQNFQFGAVGPNGFIYLCPRRFDKVVIINPENGNVWSTNYGLVLPGDQKYRGVTMAEGGDLYFIPRDANSVLIVRNTSTTQPGLKVSLSPHLNKV